MSNRVYVDNKLEFKAGAAHTNNVMGNFSPERMCSIDWFDGSTLDATNDYTVTVAGDSDAVALTGAGVPGITLTTGTTDNNVLYCATGLIFDITQEPEIEARVKIVDVSGTSFFFGFSDAVTETTPNSTIDADSGTLAAAAADAVGFVVDADLASSAVYWASIATAGSVTGAAVAPSDVWTDNITKNLRIKLDSSGNAYFYINGIQVAYKATAVTDVPLCAMFNAGTRANDGANLVYVRYLRKFQDVP